MSCRRMTSRVFALFTPSLESRSSQAASIAEPMTATVKFYWAVVQVTPFFRDAHQIYSRWRAYLVFFSRSLSCAQSRDQSAPVMMMIAFITLKSSLVPLIEGLCAQIYFRFEISVVCSHLLLFFFVKEKTC